MCPLPDDSPSRLAYPPGSAEPNEFSPEERTLLLQLAHQAITAALERREISLAPPSAHLAEPRGAFTTLYYRGALRGCVGYVFPVTSLYRTVAESARGAAFDDSRFPPVTREEAPELEVSLSILSRRSRFSRKRGGWPSRPAGQPGCAIEGYCCRKFRSSTDGIASPSWNRPAGRPACPSNAWQTGANLEAFTAEVFGDHR